MMELKRAASYCGWNVASLMLVFIAPHAAAQVAAPAPPDVRPPTPRLADGTPNLSRVEKGKGYWAPRQYRDYNDILVSVQAVPEPGFIGVLAIGLAGLCAQRYRRRKQSV